MKQISAILSEKENSNMLPNLIPYLWLNEGMKFPPITSVDFETCIIIYQSILNY